MSVPIKDKTMRFPLKIGESSRVATYAATLLQGEEQLLVTRDGKFYLTDGNGGYIEFKTNDIYDSNEIDSKITIFEGKIIKRIEELNKIIEDYNLIITGRVDENFQLIESNKESIEFNKKELEDALNLFKDETNDSISLLEKAIKDLSNSSGESFENILSLIGDIGLTDPDIAGISIVEIINNLYAKTIDGKEMIANAINQVMPTLEASKDHSYEQLSSLISEIKTGGIGGPTIQDISNHTSLPSFSKHARLNTFTAEE